MRTRSPTLFTPSSFRTDWSHSSNASPVMLFAALISLTFPTCISPRPTFKDLVVAPAVDGPQPLGHLPLVPGANVVEKGPLVAEFGLRGRAEEGGGVAGARELVRGIVRFGGEHGHGEDGAARGVGCGGAAKLDYVFLVEVFENIMKEHSISRRSSRDYAVSSKVQAQSTSCTQAGGLHCI